MDGHQQFFVLTEFGELDQLLKIFLLQLELFNFFGI